MKQLNFNVKVDGANQVTKLDKEVKSLDKSTKKTSKSTERFQGTMRGAAQAAASFQGPLGPIAGRLNSMGSLFNTLNTATNGWIKSLGVLRLALIATGIGAIVAVVGTLASAFFSTQQGVDALNSVLTPLKSGLQGVWGVIQDISTNFTDVIDGLVNGFRRVASIGLAVARGDFKTAWDETTSLISDGIDTVQDFGNEVVTAFQGGFETGQRMAELQIEIEEGQAKLVETEAKLNREFEEQRRLMRDNTLSAEERQAAAQRAGEIQDELSQARLTQLEKEIELQELSNSINDTSREDNLELIELEAERDRILQKREQKLRRIQRTEEQINKEIQDNAEEEIQIQQERLQREQDAQAELIALEEGTLQAKLDLMRYEMQRELENEDLTESEKKLIRAKYNQEEKELTRQHQQEILNIKRQAEISYQQELNRTERLKLNNIEDERLRVQQETELRMQEALMKRDQRLEEIAMEVEDEEARSIAIAEVQEEFQNNITEIEQDNAEARQQIAEAEAKAKVDTQMAVADTLGSLTRLIGEQTAMGKALGVASATIDTYVGANKALAQGGIFGAVAAAGVIATGLANVRQILSTKVPSIQGQPMGTPASSPLGSGTPQIEAPEVGPQGVRTVETIFGDDLNVNASVSVTEIEETQNRVKTIEQGAEF